MRPSRPGAGVLPAPPRTRRRLVVFRGDLRSSLGYGYHTRTLAALTPSRYEVLGVDLHHNREDDGGRFPGQLVDDTAVHALARDGSNAMVVITIATPEQFAYVPGAHNVGLFPWETDAVSYPLDWPELIAAMDANWAMTSFQRGVLHTAGWTGPCPIVPWPFDFGATGAQGGLGARPPTFRYLEALPGPDEAEDGPVDLAALPRPAFLSVSSLAPRKGLPVLLSEWRDHVDGGGAGVLVLKLRPIHHEGAQAGGQAFVTRLLENAGFRRGELVRIAYSLEELGTAALAALHRGVDAYVTATYGEGFGGPVIEALLAGRPVIAPRHTSLADLLAPDDRLQVAARSLHVGLDGASSIYPAASNWWVARQGALRRRLAEFAAMTPARRSEIAGAARRHAQAFCSREVVAATYRRLLQDRLG